MTNRPQKLSNPRRKPFLSESELEHLNVEVRDLSNFSSVPSSANLKIAFDMSPKYGELLGKTYLNQTI